MSDETYSVFDSEACDESGDGHQSGLTLEQAALRLLEGAGCVHEVRREDAVATLRVGDAESGLTPTDIVSACDEPAAARQEIYRRIVRGELPLPGTLRALTDHEYHRGLVKAVHGVDDVEADVLVKLRNGYYHTLLDPVQQRAADRLVARGLLEKLRQPRKGSPPLYKLSRSEDDLAAS